VSAEGSGGKPPPDFAMVRAVEILAQIAEKRLRQPNVPPPPIDVPVILFNENVRFQTGVTKRIDVVRELGTGFAYPAKGWDTYGLRENNERRLLSAFYKDDLLVGVEYYVPQTEGAPKLAPRDLGEFRLVPGEVRIGLGIVSLDAPFVEAVGGPGTAVYEHAFEVRYPGGVAYAMGNDGSVSRLVLYAETP
jgi:hypothetical protein